MIAAASGTENETAFLRKIRTALIPESDTTRLKIDYPHVFENIGSPALYEQIRNRNDLECIGLITSFQENSTPLNLGVHPVRDLKEAADWIARLARTAAPEFGSEKHVIQHAHPDIRELQLWKLLADDPITVHTTFSEDPELREKTKASFIGITVADWGVAESATLVQLTAADRPRSTSLVPSIHVGILRKERILANLAEAYAMLARNPSHGSITFISGPSKTADIEAHMVHGAHGPREMHVLLVG